MPPILPNREGSAREHSSAIRELARAIKFGRSDPVRLGKTVFFIGAGCSISARIPGAADIAKLMMNEAAKRMGYSLHSASAADSYAYLRDNGWIRPIAETDGHPNWYEAYDRLFEDFYRTQDDTRELFEGLVAGSRGAINWAHLCLGEMVAQNYISTILTTNFDQLVLKGLVRADVIPVVSDGVESLNRISGAPVHPQLVELHGSRHTYTLRNHPTDVSQLEKDEMAVAAITQLLQHATTFVAVGYGGRESGIMDLLVRAAKRFPEKNLFWIAHAQKETDLSSKVADFLSSSRRSTLILGQDADEFFFRLSAELGMGVPKAIREPLALAESWLSEAALAKHENADILAEMEAARRRLTAIQAARPANSPDEESRALRLSGRYAEAYELAVKTVEAAGGVQRAPVDLINELARAAFIYGSRAVDNRPLELAIQALRRLTTEAKGPNPVRAANLGGALAMLGERRGDVAMLQEAVSVLRQAVEDKVKSGRESESASELNSLGNALLSLGEASGSETFIEEAISTLRRATELADTADDIDRGTTLGNLGNALIELGKSREDATLIDEAVVAFRDALSTYSKDAFPIDWANAQNSLGTAMMLSGSSRRDVANVDSAISCFEHASQIYNANDHPIDWAMCQTNMGIALQTKSLITSDSSYIGVAIEHFDRALTVFDRSTMPIRRAGALGHKGSSLSMMAEEQSNLSLALLAQRTLEEAAEIAASSNYTDMAAGIGRWLATAKKVSAAISKGNEDQSKKRTPARKVRARQVAK